MGRMGAGCDDRVGGRTLDGAFAGAGDRPTLADSRSGFAPAVFLRTDPFAGLLPVPTSIDRMQGYAPTLGDMRVDVRVSDERVGRAVARWLAERREAGGGTPESADPPARLLVRVEGGIAPDGYRLDVGVDRIVLIGGSGAGCFHGLQTLQQLTDRATGRLPCCRIEDRPSFATRGLLHDISRGKVPTLNTLETLVDRLASLKMNQLQLYIEHAFVFRFDPSICDADSGLTPDEARDLSRYAHERFVELVPAVANLGHMGRILSMPAYRHLAEIEPDNAWEGMDWPQRQRGATLDATNPESIQLIERMLGEVMEAFGGKTVNICGDEPWDFGEGKSKARPGFPGKGVAYIDHICRVQAFCAARGRRSQAWSDVLRNHRDLLDRLPRALTILHWGYDDDTDYAAVAEFVSAGFDTVVCPGTSGWKRIVNAMGLAERNIATFADVGARHGATGLLNTDWGDDGHFNALACSWHGIALGGAKAWNADGPIGSEFDRRFATFLAGQSEDSPVALLRDVSALGEVRETWRLLWCGPGCLADGVDLPALDELNRSIAAAERLIDWCASLAADRYDPRDVGEWRVAAKMTGLLARRLRGLCETASGANTPYFSDQSPLELSTELRAACESFADCWLRRNKPGGLADIRRALSHVADDIESEAAR